MSTCVCCICIWTHHACLYTYTYLGWCGDKSYSQLLAARADGCLCKLVQGFETLQKDALATCFIWTGSWVALELSRMLLSCTQSCCQPLQSGLIKSQWQGPQSQDQPRGEQDGVRRELLPHHCPPHPLVLSGATFPWQIPLVKNAMLHPEHGPIHGENVILGWGVCWGLFDFSTPEVP